MKIKDIKGYEILTTAGTSSVCVELFIDNEFSGYTGSAAQGVSKSIYEPSYEGSIRSSNEVATELLFTPQQGNINQAIAEIKRAVVDKDLAPEDIDKILCDVDGTEHKQRLGSSLILATSIAAWRAEAAIQEQFLSNFIQDKLVQADEKGIPKPVINIINGGLHASLPTIAIQEILLVPVQEQVGISTVIFQAQAIFLTLQKLLRKKSIFYGFGLEGGIAAQWEDFEEPIDLLLEAIYLNGLSDDFAIGFDCAASAWFEQKSGKYKFFNQGKQFSSEQLMAWYASLIKKYPIQYIEDPFSEHDYEAWKEMYRLFSKGRYIVGDDLCATQACNIERADIHDMINAIIIKPSQAGTITEMIKAIDAARTKKLEIVVSRRSCETNDDFIIDLALAGSSFFKFGNITQGAIERYNTIHTFFVKVATEALVSLRQNATED